MYVKFIYPACSRFNQFLEIWEVRKASVEYGAESEG